ncbi:HTH_48 domain-containing protein [Trichonephila clavipes]|nr:HTH_48 domain-containing protein [Trichonephila clavipes]
MVKYDQRSGRPISSKTPEIIEKVRNFVANDHCTSLRMMTDSLNINKEIIGNVCAKFVPDILSPEQKAMRSAHCSDLISTAENNPNFLKSIVTGDVKRCVSNTTLKKTSRKISSTIKTMLITFFDARDIIHNEFVPTGQTITVQYYLDVLTRLMIKIRCIRLEQGWRTNGTRANDGTRQNILGTRSIKNDLHFSLK